MDTIIRLYLSQYGAYASKHNFKYVKTTRDSGCVSRVYECDCFLQFQLTLKQKENKYKVLWSCFDTISKTNAEHSSVWRSNCSERILKLALE